MNNVGDQYMRKVGLLVQYYDPTNPKAYKETIDLSEFRVKFEVKNADYESPDHASIRVYNLSEKTVRKIFGGGYNVVGLSAGYQGGNYGTIFAGEIKQIRVGKEDPTTTYMDILAADGDIFYNQAIFAQSMAKGTNNLDQIKKLVDDYNTQNNTKIGIDTSAVLSDGLFNSTNVRGKVWFGIARSSLRDIARTANLTWSIQNGDLVFTDYRGYKEGTAVVLDSAHGLIGMPEQTEGGVMVKCLLNPKIRIGGLVKLDNDNVKVNQTLFVNNKADNTISYDKYRQIQALVPLSEKGIYRAYAVEYSGDSRGQDWYSKLTCLAVNPDVPIQMSTGDV